MSVALNPITGVFIREKSWSFGHRDTKEIQREESRVKIETENEAMHLQTEKCQGLLGAIRS